jgi:hypothetical protein
MKKDKLSNEIKEIVDNLEEAPDMRDNLEEVMPTILVKRLKKLPLEFVDKTPAELEEMFKKNGLKLSETIETLRDAFWLEYDRAVQSGRKMMTENIYYDICLERTFRDIYSHPLKLAYITSPIIKYDARLSSLLRINSISIIKEILEAPMYDENGNLNDKIAKLKLSAINSLQDRTLGTAIQKSEVKQMTVNIDSGTSARSVEEIQKRIAEVEKELRIESNQKRILELEQELKKE